MSSSERKRVVIIGSSFAGLTTAFELKKKVGDRHEIVVLDPRPHFTFIPSLIWLPFGGREAKDLTFALAPIYARKGIRFVNEAAKTIDPAGHTVGSCFGAPYEFMFNAHHQIKKAGLQDVAPVTFITAEPFVGHFGLGGVGNSEQLINRFFDGLGIEGRPNTVIKEARHGEIELDDGTILPAAYSMIVPPFTGVDAVRTTEGLGNPMGFIPVDEQFRHTHLPDVFAAGVAIAIGPPEPTPVPAGVPKTGHMTEAMAKVAAHNIAADIDGTDRHLLPLGDLDAMCILDAGNNGVMFKANHVLSTNGHDKHAHVMAGPQAHWAKVAFEHDFIGSRKRGVLAL